MTIEELKGHLSAIGANFIISAISALEEEAERLRKEVEKIAEDAEKKNAVHTERLKQAMAREEALRRETQEIVADYRRLQEEHSRTLEEFSRLDSHPEVRAKKRAALLAQIADLSRRADELAEPQAKPKAKAKTEPTSEKE